MHPVDEKIRFTNFVGLTRRGVDRRGASVAALALHPMDSDQQPVSRRLEKALRKRSKKLAKRLKKADAADALDLATEALRDYHSLAVGHADPYYGRFYSARLEAAQDHEAWEEDLQALDDAQSSP